MRKTITIDSCTNCPQATSNGIEPICSLKFIGNVLPKNLSIPTWCPLPDTQDKGWQDIEIKRLREALKAITEVHIESHEDAFVMLEYAKEALKPFPPQENKS
ncbi:MAG: hypothetical protein OEV64_13325 [Desulfobulbaceae bacterium]|nr:hypothetical protein [Desulfobulbaceae bacterium]